MMRIHSPLMELNITGGVWSIAKQLLTLLPSADINSTSQIPPKLLIASYMHDIGMSVETGIRHGVHSRNMCVEFLKNNNLHPDDYLDVLEAIENHDRKEYPPGAVNNEILKILSVADDLDAFGFTGIFRYIEIYLARGVKPVEIGYLIKKNAAKRFDHFIQTFGFTDSIVVKHRKRYTILENFFSEYNIQAATYQFGGKNPSGYCGVVEMQLHMINNKLALKDFLNGGVNYKNDPIISWYFSEIAKEL